MSLSSLALDAFVAVARTGAFTAAARELGLTQSALSQRILNLESELGVPLLVRGPGGARPTAFGEALLSYALTKERLEAELLASRNARRGPTEISGLVRIGGFSTLNASLLIPALGSFRARHPRVSFEVLSLEVRELLPALRRGRIDLCLTTEKPAAAGIESEHLGDELNVQVRRAADRETPARFLDHDEADTTSLEFLRAQGVRSPNPPRDFLGDIHGILAGVRAGLGTAVVPRHLVGKGLREVPRRTPLRVPVHLAFVRQSYDPRLMVAVKEHLRAEIRRALSGS